MQTFLAENVDGDRIEIVEWANGSIDARSVNGQYVGAYPSFAALLAALSLAGGGVRVFPVAITIDQSDLCMRIVGQTCESTR